jgi:hypothetical protein
MREFVTRDPITIDEFTAIAEEAGEVPDYPREVIGWDGKIRVTWTSLLPLTYLEETLDIVPEHHEEFRHLVD